ncbi:hypothetical protein BABINDRAFT_42185 [Babjeviella inositovora NRRL Y-12698]|uniref:Mitochondrial import inner membrane translocase subunit Tim21 n=1 Tax=Babjeviella inositovora NRRL Y-12698 TaxID=984486 RepID=A0A1E3QJ86_9ASCO|nr:uncharacterized protein BABINDRAFT_42185 [Babjeviella inositovora NRRL Y-12698]ODQ77132.1 hypothetical protein BABINDRAFT_42185 [Babjeviella inositovora NRRL Y-12698]
MCFNSGLRHSKAYSTASSVQPPKAPKVSLWTRLSRASTFVFASSLVLGAVSLAGFVIYLLFAEILLPSGETQVFNRAVSLIEKDAECQALLNFPAGERLKAYGETDGNRWTRNRPIHSQKKEGKDGKSHLMMKFHVETNSGRHGSVTLENIEDSALESNFAYIALDIRGQKRHYVIAPKFNTVARHKATGLFDLKWGSSKRG